MMNMKPSGIQWIGEMPSEWNTLKLKYLVGVQAGYAFDSSQFSLTSGVPLIRIRDITSGEISTFYTGDYSDEYIVHNGDVLIGMDGDFNVRYWENADALLNQRCCRIIDKGKINKKYVYYCMPYDLQRINDVTYSTTVKHLSNWAIENISVPVPGFEEQQAIASYLDDRCSKLDEIITEAEKSIEEYKELKLAVIANAVLRGLKDNVTYKNTGEKWCVTIPYHWRFERGKNLFRETNIRSIDGSEELLTVSQYTGITPRSMKNVTMFEATSLVDYKICAVGDIAANTMWMWAGAVGVSGYYGVISPSYNTYRQIKGDYNSRYLDYLLRAVPLVSEYESLSTGIRASRLRLYPSQFLSIRYPVPPMTEQKDIVEFLDRKVGDMDALISEKQSLIEDLKAYKKSLIYEVVTGKRRIS